jgi:hypothetical protein
MSAITLGRSRKRDFIAKPKVAKRKPKRAETIQQVRKRREKEKINESFSQACFGVSSDEVKRRGIVIDGRGKGTKYRLGDYDGSDNPAA